MIVVFVVAYSFLLARSVIPTEAKELKTKGFQLLFFFSQVYCDLLWVT